jgi:hypothetical protein
VHYVTCIGDGYMLQNLYQTRHMLYQPIWLYALCDLYWEQVHAAKTYTGHILYHLWLYDCVYVHRDHIISAHLAVCIMWPVLGTGTCCKLISTHIISLLIIWLHVLYISGHILYQPIWLCALCSLYWEQVHSAKLISTHIICDYMIACNVHIATYIFISVRLAVCIM